MAIPVTLSTASVYPGEAEIAFSLARDLQYDGLEVMVLGDPTSREALHLVDLINAYQVPVLSIHAPTLLLTQRVWGGAWEKIDRSIDLAKAVGAELVVLHPPFLWQRAYHKKFIEGVLAREEAAGVVMAVENMYPWRVARDFVIYRPHWDPISLPYPSVTLDLSHAATARSDSLAMAVELGPRLKHLHLTDGTSTFKDDHLVPGDGTQRAAEVLQLLAAQDYQGQVCVEVVTRGMSTAGRDEALARSIDFARKYLGQDPQRALRHSLGGMQPT